MHSSLVLLTLASLVLIILMVTCFICFIRSRRDEDEELVEQVQQYNNQIRASQQQLSTPTRGQHHQKSPSNEIMINDSSNRQFQGANQQHTSRDQLVAEYQARNTYAASASGVSPYHSAEGAVLGAPSTPRTETRSDITQQINSAIIGSSEAEFQNDFIQVFPMYQIAPQPEKNTTPYLT